jgi:hypothetical protein
MANDKTWNEKLMQTLRQTGDTIRAEAQKLVDELADPANQEQVKQKLSELGDWAKKAAEQAAESVEEMVSSATAKMKAARKTAKKKPAPKAKKKTAAKKKKKR